MKIASSLIWGGLYLAMIPLFGFIYSKMDRGFYQNTIKLEQAYSRDSSRAADAICTVLKDDIGGTVRYPLTFQSRQLVFQYSPKDLECDSSVTEVSRLNAGLHVTLVSHVLPTQGTTIAGNVSEVLQPIEIDVSISPRMTDIVFGQMPVPIDPTMNIIDMAMTFSSKVTESTLIGDPVPRGQSRWGFKPDAVKFQFALPKLLSPQIPNIERRLEFGSTLEEMMDITDKKESATNDNPVYSTPKFKADRVVAYQDLTRFLEASDGYTSDVSDNLSRMMYFSATTITTLGLGDIVPVTSLARWMVFAETVCGVIFIGLFLHSITRGDGK